MKTIKIIALSAIAAALLFAGCCKDNDNTPASGSAKVKVSVNDFTISQEEIPSKDAIASYNSVKNITLAFYTSDGTEVYKQTQNRNALGQGETFGEFATSLPIGSYTMVVLGYVLYDDDELTLTSPTQAEYTGGCPRETFAVTQAVNITSTNDVNLSATLDRIVTCLQVISTDGRTANVNKVRMTFAAGGKQFSPATGLATVNTGSVSTVGVSAAEGTISTSIGYVFLTTDEQTMDVTIETLDADGNTIYSKTVNDVPFKRNRRTKLTGAIYGANADAGSFQVNTTWISDYNMNF